MKPLRAATWAAAAMHPHSCAQPRAQLLEACAWQEFGTCLGSQNRNLKMRVFDRFAKSEVYTMRAATWAAAAMHPHSCAQPRAQLLEACARQGFGTCGRSRNRNLKIIVFDTFAKPEMNTVRVATWAADATHPHSCAQPRTQRHARGRNVEPLDVPKIVTGKQ